MSVIERKWKNYVFYFLLFCTSSLRVNKSGLCQAFSVTIRLPPLGGENYLKAILQKCTVLITESHLLDFMKKKDTYSELKMAKRTPA